MITQQTLNNRNTGLIIRMMTGLFFIVSVLLSSVSYADHEQELTNEELFQELQKAQGEEKTQLYLDIMVKNRSNQPQITIEYGEQALEHFERFPNDADKVLVLCNMSWSHMVLGQYNEAETLAEQGLSLAETIDEIRSLIVPLNIAGLAYWRQGRYDEALDYYFRALEVTRELADVRGEATTLNNIGLIYIEQETVPRLLITLPEPNHCTRKMIINIH